jgi:diadenosine tetraphosphatase ApaH/serine/threonine PP2A family protein phosphatase
MANVTPRHTVDRESIDLSEGRFIINPGSVGQPRDGDNRAAFAIYEPKRNRLTFRRVAYPIEETQEQMREQGLPDSLINRLAHGI